MTITIEFAPGTPNEQTATLSARASSLNPVRAHTGVSDVRGTLRGDRSLEQFAQRQDRINIKSDGETIWTGYAVGISHNKQSGQTDLEGDGIGKRLEETRPDYDSIGGPVTYSNTPLHDALRDYWPRTPFQNFSVTDQSTELVAEDEQVQDADTTTEWQDWVSIPDTSPFYIENGELRLGRSNMLCDLGETGGENGLSEASGTTFNDGDDYSGGRAMEFDNGAGDAWSVDFTLHHTIPEDDVIIAARLESDSDSLDLSLTLLDDGDNEMGSVQIHNSISSDLLWKYTGGDFDLPGWTDGAIEAGDYSFRVSAESASAGGSVFVDIVAIMDGRYPYNFDGDNGGNGGYLDGPELYPDSATLQLDTFTTGFNVTAADIISTWDDTSGPQEIAVSNDAGGSFERASNTETLSTSFDSAGREMLAEFTFGRYGSRTDLTPQEGYLGQSIDSYSLSIDGNNLVVIVDLELSRNHFDNLKKLHEYGDFLWVIEHDDGPISDMVVSSFRRGEEERPAPDGFENQINQQPEIVSATYYNSIYLEGELRDDDTRPSAEVKDQDAIDEVRDEISPGVLRDPSITTEAGAEFRAQALLDAALSNNNLVGKVTVPPMMVHPAYARPVDFGNGEVHKTVEKVSLNLSQGSADASFDYTGRSILGDEFSELKRNSKDQGNQV